ncbi:MAG: hypothetical protein WA792_18470 [Pseudolabrys sp.]
MKKAEEYYHHAEECREMARTASRAEHKAALENMAATWAALAKNRKETIARRQRIDALEVPSSRCTGGLKRNE